MKDKASKVVFDSIYEKIRSEEWPSGYKLPPEISISEQFGVSRNTVREAIQNLINRGYLKRVHGVGSFVLNRIINYGMEELLSLSELIEENGYQPGTIQVNLEIGLPDKKTVKYLELSNYDSIYKVSRVKTADLTPVVYEEGIYPCNILQAITAKDFEGSVFQMLESRNIVIQYANGWVKPKIADKKLSKALKVEVGTPLLLLETILFDQDNRAIMYVNDYFTEWFQFPIRRVREITK